MSTDLELMHTTARAAGEILRRYFHGRDALTVEAKGPSDFVSRADREAEDAIRSRLLDGRPDAAYRGEESDYQRGSSALEWVVDPLDGTTNFLSGIPHFAVSIALREAGQTVAAVVYQPITDELFSAALGEGARLDGVAVRGSPRRGWAQAVVATGVPHHGRPNHRAWIEQFERVGQRVGGVRRFGAAALDLAWTAAGRFDGFWEQDLNPWDVAAGNLLVREAGGVVTAIAEADDPDSGVSVIAAGRGFHPEFAAVVRGD